MRKRHNYHFLTPISLHNKGLVWFEDNTYHRNKAHDRDNMLSQSTNSGSKVKPQRDGATSERDIEWTVLQQLALHIVSKLGSANADGSTSTDIVQIVAVETQAVGGNQRGQAITAYSDPGRDVPILMAEHGGTSEGKGGMARRERASVALVWTALAYQLLPAIGNGC